MAKRTDDNQKAIVDSLRKRGVSVLILSDVGKGCPDLCIGFGGRSYLVEVKNGALCPSRRKLTQAEQLFFDSWKGHATVISSVEQAMEFIDSTVFRPTYTGAASTHA